MSLLSLSLDAVERGLIPDVLTRGDSAVVRAASARLRSRQ